MFTCRLCEGERHTLVYESVPDYFMRTGIPEDYARCDDCGLLQARERRADLSPLYASYQLHQPKGRVAEVTRRFVMRRAYERVAPPAPGSRFLDYGCGDGSHLVDMRARGWNVTGVEMSAGYARELSARIGAEVRHCDADLGDLAGAFERVTMNMVLEHVESPREHLQRVFALLRPGGVFHAIIPNIESREAAAFGRRWHDLDPPRHRTFLTRAHLRRLLGELGFEAPRFDTVSIGASFAGSALRLCSPRYDPRLLVALLPVAEVWAAVVRDSALRTWASRPAR